MVSEISYIVSESQWKQADHEKDLSPPLSMEASAGLIDKFLASGGEEWVTQLSLHARVVLFLERVRIWTLISVTALF